MTSLVHYRLPLPCPQRDDTGPGWTSIWAREGTSDEDVIHETFIEDTYRLRGLDLRVHGDEAPKVVIDLGANIGCVSALCLTYGASRVIAVEPEPNNLELLARNVEKWKQRVDIVPGAVAAEAGKVALWGGEGTGHTEPVDDKGGLVVQAFTLAQILSWVVDRVALCKIDIEGGEYDAICACPSDQLARIDHIAMETHGPGIGCTWIVDAPKKYGQMVAHLTKTHAVSAFGDPANGGALFAHAYERPS